MTHREGMTITAKRRQREIMALEIDACRSKEVKLLAQIAVARIDNQSALPRLRHEFKVNQAAWIDLIRELRSLNHELVTLATYGLQVPPFLFEPSLKLQK